MRIVQRANPDGAQGVVTQCPRGGAVVVVIVEFYGESAGEAPVAVDVFLNDGREPVLEQSRTVTPSGTARFEFSVGAELLTSTVQVGEKARQGAIFEVIVQPEIWKESAHIEFAAKAAKNCYTHVTVPVYRPGLRVLQSRSDLTCTNVFISNRPTDEYLPSADSIVILPKPRAKLDPRLYQVEVFSPGTEADELTVSVSTPHDTDCLSQAIDNTLTARRYKDHLAVYRTPPFRFVVDTIDHAAARGQAVLVTDSVSGSAPFIDILGQKVLFSVTDEDDDLSGEVEVGDRRKRYIRTAFHVFREESIFRQILDPTNADASRVFDPLDPGADRAALEADIINVLDARMSPFRRVYAQANLAPCLGPPLVTFLDPPEKDTICISQWHGNPAGCGGTLELDLYQIGEPREKLFSLTWRVREGETPQTVASNIWTELLGKIRYKGVGSDVFTNATCLSRQHPSVDLRLRLAGQRVEIANLKYTPERAVSDDITFQAVKANLFTLRVIEDAEEAAPNTAETRQVLRAAPTARNRLDFIVIFAFNSAGTAARAFTPDTAMSAPYQQREDLRYNVLVRAATVDVSALYPFTLPHEAGHALIDCLHTQPTLGAQKADPDKQLMKSGTSQNNTVAATKRICDETMPCNYTLIKDYTAGPAGSKVPSSAVERVVEIDAEARIREVSQIVLQGWGSAPSG